jgi:hypothetical protein
MRGGSDPARQPSIIVIPRRPKGPTVGSCSPWQALWIPVIPVAGEIPRSASRPWDDKQDETRPWDDKQDEERAGVALRRTAIRRFFVPRSYLFTQNCFWMNR